MTISSRRSIRLIHNNRPETQRKLPVHIIHSIKQDWITRHLLRVETSIAMRAAAQNIERRFSVEFESFTHFSASDLANLRNLPDAARAFQDKVTVASNHDPAILSLIDLLTSIANSKNASLEDRRRYWDALVSIYARLPFQPASCKNDPDTLLVGIQREGFLLASAMDCMPPSHSIAPNAKRIPFENGLLVGLLGVPELPHFRQCIVIDGAIASGATIIALLEQLQRAIRSFHICSAHATAEGCLSILQFARLAGLELKITVGHVTHGLNDHFYATLPGDSSKLVVGDLGDTISELS